MKYRWDELPRSLRDSFLSTLIRVQNDLTPADVANLLWALSVVDFPLDTSASYITDLVFNAISETMSEMKAAEIARSVWGLSGCGMAWDQLPSTLQW